MIFSSSITFFFLTSLVSFLKSIRNSPPINGPARSSLQHMKRSNIKYKINYDSENRDNKKKVIDFSRFNCVISIQDDDEKIL